MITGIIVALAAWGVIAIAVTVYTMLSAKEGYEDEEGFHPKERTDRDRRRSGAARRNEPPPRAEMTLVVGPVRTVFDESEPPTRPAVTRPPGSRREFYPAGDGTDGFTRR